MSKRLQPRVGDRVRVSLRHQHLWSEEQYEVLGGMLGQVVEEKEGGANMLGRRNVRSGKLLVRLDYPVMIGSRAVKEHWFDWDDLIRDAP